MFGRIGALITKEFIQLRRDLFFVLLILLGAPSEMSAVAFATGAEVTNLPTTVCDHDHSPESRELVQSLANVDTFEMIESCTSTDELTALLDRGQAYVGVTIPPRFGADLRGGENRAQVQVILNGAESAAAKKAQSSINGAVARYVEDYAARSGRTSTAGAIQPSARVWYNEELRQANYTIPSELGFILYVIAVWVAALGIARERELGTLEQLMVTPIRKTELVIGKSIPAVAVGYSTFLMMLAMVVFVFKVPMRGSLLLLLVLAFFYILVELQRGLLISVVAKTQQQGLLAVFLMAFIDMTFSGYAVPVESMPPVLQAISNVFPIRHWMIIMRGIMLKGVGLEVVWPHVLIIGGLGVVLAGMTLLAFRRALGD
jgi:ABC-2 type transport system permease protein